MARNKPTKPLAEAPPEPDSSEEDEEPEEEHSSTESDEKPLSTAPHAASSSTDADDDDEDDEQHQLLQQSPATPPPPFSPPSKKPTTKKPTTAAAVPAATPQSSSDEDKEESDSDDEPELPVSKLKSTSKPTSPPPKSRSKPTIAALPAGKRPSDTPSLDKEKPSKKPKKDITTPSTKPTPLSPGPGPSEDGSKKLFQRVFSEEDEIEILKGLSDFKERKGSDPLKNDDEFYGFIKKRVLAEVNKAQMNDKVRRLKRKFVNNAKNKKRKSLNDHESKLFELSKRIWEVKDEDDDGDVKVSNGGGVKDGEKSSLKKSGKSYGGHDGGKDNGVVVSVVGVKSVSRSKEEESEGGDGDGDEMEEDFRVGENEVKGVMRGEALRRMGEKGRNEIREIWRKVENAQLEVDLMRSQARVEENKRIMEALGLLKR